MPALSFPVMAGDAHSEQAPPAAQQGCHLSAAEDWRIRLERCHGYRASRLADTSIHQPTASDGQLLRRNGYVTDTGRSRLLYAAIDARSFPLRLRGAAVCFAIHEVTLSIVSDRGARPFLMR